MGSLIRRDGLFPNRDDFFFPLEQHFNKFWDEFFGTINVSDIRAAGGFPKMNICQDDLDFMIVAAVAGYDEDEIQVEVSPDNVVTISGKKKNTEKTTGKYYIRELKSSEFSRKVKLPDTIEGDPEAVLGKGGMLSLIWKLKRPEVKSEVKKIQIKSEKSK
jgi:HSP20 family protein